MSQTAKTIPLDTRDFAVVDFHSGVEKTPDEVTHYVDEARRNQLRVVSREDLTRYRQLADEMRSMRDVWRTACPAPGPVQAIFTVEKAL